jgi:hypothetical protein
MNLKFVILFLQLLIVNVLFAQLPPDDAFNLASVARLKQKDKGLNNEPKQYANLITAKKLQEILTIVASDKFEGRETATKGQKMAEEFLVSKIRELGVPPIKREGVSKEYLQEMPFTKVDWESVTMDINGKSLQFLRDFYTFKKDNGTLDKYTANEIVFLGYGIEHSKYNDYQNVDVKGKTVIIFSGEPKDKKGNYIVSGSTIPSQFSVSEEKKLKIAQEKGVKALLIIDPRTAKHIGEFRRWLVEPTVAVGKPEKQEGVLTNYVFVAPDVAATLLGDKKRLESTLKKIEKKGKPISFTVPCNFSLEIKKKTEVVYSTNIMAFIEGSDEELKNEIVLITAHYDHLGKRGDDIYYGADDNGSGTSSLLAITEAFMTAKKEGKGARRSILIMWVSGEEKGLLGSEYYVANPIFPLENTIVDVNVDMVGRVDEKYKDNPNYIYVIGSDRLSSELHEINEEANQRYTNLTLDYTYNAEDDPNRYYYRSDHYNFAEKGIPAIFYFNGTHDDYHKVTDTADKINYDKMALVAQLVFFTSWELANRDNRIIVDKK